MGMACGHALLRRINVHLCILITVFRQLRCSIGWQFKQLRRFMKCFIDWQLRQLRYSIGWLFCWGVDALFVCANSQRFSV